MLGPASGILRRKKRWCLKEILKPLSSDVIHFLPSQQRGVRIVMISFSAQIKALKL
jgi:hypothetical protein